MTDLSLSDLVLLHLPSRREQAVTIASLASRLGEPKRAVEQALQELADSGKYPICATTVKPYGVWLGSVGEVEQYVERLQSRLSRQYLRIRGLRRCAKAMRQPAVLFPELQEAS